jgi:6-phosphofructokinase
LALSAGIAGGADVILIPKIPYDIAQIVQKIEDVSQDEKRNHALIVCAEAACPKNGEAVYAEQSGHKVYGGIAHKLGHDIHTLSGAETRVTVLGHVQRGGSPSSFDRVLASSFGVYALDLLASGVSGRMVSWWDGSVRDVDLSTVVDKEKSVNLMGSRMRAARGLGICFGD